MMFAHNYPCILSRQMLLTQLCAVMKRQDKENTCRLEVSFWPFMGESLSTSTSEVFLIEVQKRPTLNTFYYPSWEKLLSDNLFARKRAKCWNLTTNISSNNFQWTLRLAALNAGKKIEPFISKSNRRLKLNYNQFLTQRAIPHWNYKEQYFKL